MQNIHISVDLGFLKILTFPHIVTLRGKFYFSDFQTSVKYAL